MNWRPSSGQWYLRRHLGVFLTRVVEGLDAEVRHEIEQEKTLATKFDVTTINPTTIEELEQ